MADPKKPADVKLTAEEQKLLESIRKQRAAAKARRETPEAKAKAKAQREKAAAERKALMAKLAKAGVEV